MPSLLQRLLKAYRPLYLRGVLLDGRFHLPAQVESRQVVSRRDAATVNPSSAQRASR